MVQIQQQPQKLNSHIIRTTLPHTFCDFNFHVVFAVWWTIFIWFRISNCRSSLVFCARQKKTRISCWLVVVVVVLYFMPLTEMLNYRRGMTYFPPVFRPTGIIHIYYCLLFLFFSLSWFMLRIWWYRDLFFFYWVLVFDRNRVYSGCGFIYP